MQFVYVVYHDDDSAEIFDDPRAAAQACEGGDVYAIPVVTGVASGDYPPIQIGVEPYRRGGVRLCPPDGYEERVRYSCHIRMENGGRIPVLSKSQYRGYVHGDYIPEDAAESSCGGFECASWHSEARAFELARRVCRERCLGEPIWQSEWKAIVWEWDIAHGADPMQHYMATGTIVPEDGVYIEMDQFRAVQQAKRDGVSNKGGAE